MKKYIKSVWHKLLEVKNFAKGELVGTHEWFIKHGVYIGLTKEFIGIAVVGFLISISLVAFGVTWRPYLFLSYGLIPWLLVQLTRYACKELEKK